SIHGITLDYGPYGWLEDYNPQWTPNTTDRHHKRYRFENQPQIAQWNLLQLANALYPLINEAKPLENILNNFSIQFEKEYLKMMHQKLGFEIYNEETQHIVLLLKENLQSIETDMTIFFRNLSTINKSDSATIALEKIKESFYDMNELKDVVFENWIYWFSLYIKLLQNQMQSDLQRKNSMNAVNPKYILRNYMAQLVIDDAEKGDYSLLNEMYQLLLNPYDEQPEFNKWFSKRPEWAKHKIGCSVLSCSS
ncbi:MAG TPA: hypothetical protein DDZ41_08105, partial [Flavobacterium sp.]|nr:hypothetical protein [Flavobacterium sp.]